MNELVLSFVYSMEIAHTKRERESEQGSERRKKQKKNFATLRDQTNNVRIEK